MIYLISYLFGSILFGVIVAKGLKIENLREKGSGNVGATNIARVSGNKKVGMLVAVLDGLKGAIPVILSKELGLGDPSIVGAAAVLGHILPIWHKFKGGKGVATFIGMVMSLNWELGLVAGAAWIGTFSISKISSLSSIVMVLVTVCMFFNIPIGVIGLVIVLKHQENIKRLMSGKEESLK